jgi:protein-arginine kinase activator protein McsA
LEQAGLENENAEKNTTPATITAEPVANDLTNMSLAELNKLLQEVLEQEDYIRAIDIRDEINKKTAQKKS